MWHYTILQKTLELWLLKSMSIYWVQNFLTERRSNKFNLTYSKQVYFLHFVFQISTMSCSVSSVPTVSSENLKNYIHAIIMVWFLWVHSVHIISGKDSQEQCFPFSSWIDKICTKSVHYCWHLFPKNPLRKWTFVLLNPNGFGCFFGWLEKSSSPSAALEREILSPTNPAQLG